MTITGVRGIASVRPSRRRRAAWVAVLATVVWSAASTASPPDPDPAVLRAAFREALAEARWESAIEAGLELERATGGWWGDRYNLACAYLRTGRRGAGIEWLIRSVESGLYRVRLVDEDDDLAPVRDDPRFAAIRAAVARNWDAYAAEVRHRFEQAPPIVVLPKGYEPSRPAPLLIALHGHGGRADGWPLQWREVTSKMGVVLAAAQSVHPLGGGFTWVGPDEADLIVDLTLERVRRECSVDPRRVVLTGFSEGGYIAWALGVRHRGRFVAVIPMAAPFIEGADVPPHASGSGEPRYIFMVGSGDDLQAQTRKAAEAFRAAGYQSELRVYRSKGHTFPIALVPELRRALTGALGDDR